MTSLKSRIKDFSVLVSQTLDNMGYSQNIIQERQQFWRDFPQNLPNPMASFFVSGSKGEGIASLYENDLDVMIILKGINCLEDIQQSAYMRDISVFQMDTEDTAPGYTRLRLVQSGSSMFYETSELTLTESNTNQLYLSCDEVINGIKTASLDACKLILTRAGPSAQIQFRDVISGDFVLSIRCNSPSTLSSWLTRKRQHNWPTQEVIHKISTMDGHVVPVGFKGSARQSEEWRICYTMAELELIQKFTDTQVKVYVLLKYLARDVLKDSCGVVTSYLMKNVVFWISELTPQAHSSEELLIDMLVNSLKLLHKFVKSAFCPSYMISRRNLFSGKLGVVGRRKLLTQMQEMIDEGGSMLLRCEMLGVCLTKMYKVPRLVRIAGENKCLIERLHRMHMTSFCEGDTEIQEELESYIFLLTRDILLRDCFDVAVAVNSFNYNDLQPHVIELCLTRLRQILS